MTAPRATNVEDAVARLLDQREAQGFPRHVEDPVALAAVADLIDHAHATNGRSRRAPAVSDPEHGGPRARTLRPR